MSIIALIPARGGSKRIKSKNIKELDGHPMLAYTIAAAVKSNLFERIIVSTDSEEIAAIAKYYGAEVPFLRPKELAGDHSMDIEWIQYTLKELDAVGNGYEFFAILRPTSPFRQAETIVRAWEQFSRVIDVDSIRAVEKCTQHPGKMWVISNHESMAPLLDSKDKSKPWHSMPYQSLPEIYVQNASLEIAKTEMTLNTGTIAGEHVVPFITEGYEGFDINNEIDWLCAEILISEGKAQLPEITVKHYGG